MHNLRLLGALCAAVCVLAGCASGNLRLKNMTASEVSRLIVDNQTPLFEIVSRLGEPNKSVVDSNGEQTFEFYWVKSSPSPMVVVPFNFVPEFPTTKKTLRIWVNADGIITRHELSGVYYVYRRPYIGSDSAHSFRMLTQEELDDLVDPTEVEQKSSEAASAAPTETLPAASAERSSLASGSPQEGKAPEAAPDPAAPPTPAASETTPSLRIQ